MSSEIKYVSVCSGMEAASVAWHPLGWKPVCFSEIEPFPCAILKHRFPNTPNYGSLTEYQSWPVGPGSADLLVGGTPCQSFSVAGLRKGLEDPRGNLALTFLGLANRIKPRWIVWENVPGVLSSNGGRDLGSFLGALVQLGYGFAYRVLDAQHFGVPQRRRRIFVVACLGNAGAAAQVLFESDCLRRDSSSRRKKGEVPAASAEGGAGADHQAGSALAFGGNNTSGPIKVTTALLGHSSVRGDFESETFIRQPVAFTPSSFAQYAEGIGTIRANGGDLGGGSEGLVVKPIAFKVRGGGNCSGTKGGEVKPGIGGGTGYLGSEDKTFTVATSQDQWLAAPVAQAEVAGPLDAHYYKGPGSRQGGEREYVAHPPAMAVRRLTPVECERLQGFPDNWSRIPWKGKPEEDCPDGPRYKACGNSMAVPVMRWIGQRIAQVDATL